MLGQPRIIIVLGVRRSGTSALVKGLETMGVSIVDQASTPFNSFNEKGYWEDLEVHHFNMKLTQALEPLEHRRRSILSLSEEEVDFLCDQKFLEQGCHLMMSRLSSTSQSLGFKDPRFSILLPFWKKVFQECKISVSFVIALRDPNSTVTSMKAFGQVAEELNVSNEKFLWVWIAGLLGILEASEGEERILVDYQELLKQPAFEMNRIANAFQLKAREDLLASYSSHFIDPVLCHFKEGIEFYRGVTEDHQFAFEIYQQLAKVAKDQISLVQLEPLREQWSARLSAAQILLTLAEKNEQLILLLQTALSQSKK